MVSFGQKYPHNVVAEERVPSEDMVPAMKEERAAGAAVDSTKDFNKGHGGP